MKCSGKCYDVQVGMTQDLLFSPRKMKKDQSNNKGGFLQG